MYSKFKLWADKLVWWVVYYLSKFIRSSFEFTMLISNRDLCLYIAFNGSIVLCHQGFLRKKHTPTPWSFKSSPSQSYRITNKESKGCSKDPLGCSKDPLGCSKDPFCIEI